MINQENCHMLQKNQPLIVRKGSMRLKESTLITNGHPVNLANLKSKWAEVK